MNKEQMNLSVKINNIAHVLFCFFSQKRRDTVTKCNITSQNRPWARKELIEIWSNSNIVYTTGNHVLTVVFSGFNKGADSK